MSVRSKLSNGARALGVAFVTTIGDTFRARKIGSIEALTDVTHIGLVVERNTVPQIRGVSVGA